MFEWGVAFIKITGKISWLAINKVGVMYHAEPTTVLGCVVISTSLLAGTYLFGPDLLNLITSAHNDSLDSMTSLGQFIDIRINKLTKG